jgi:ribosome-binding protein aMBF1 (putative translation factor)
MNRIKKVLQEKGIKQMWLAEKLGKSFKIVSSYAHNRIQSSFGNLISDCGDITGECKRVIN